MSHAVHVSPGGTGQVLLFPYYTARGGYNTLITVVNTQDNTKAVKVRFLEGKNSREVLDFNLFLAPNDIWTGAVVGTAAGARLVTNDNSCVLPLDLFTETRVDAQGLAPNEFKNTQYTGANVDSTTMASLDRAREGFFEVIEMGVIDPINSSVIAFIKPGSSNRPVNCSALTSYEPTPGNTNAVRFPNVGAPLMIAPQGGLTGRASLIRADDGSNFTFSATALEAWSDKVAYTIAGDLGPSLADVSPRTSMVLVGEGTVTAQWAEGRDAVSAALMRYSVKNEFILDSGTASKTDWVVTFPTKRFYVAVGPGPAQAPFSSNFATNGPCDPYGYSIFDREARLAGSRSCPGGCNGERVCWTANIMPFATPNLALSANNFSLLSLSNEVSGALTNPGPYTTLALNARQGPNGTFSLNFNNTLPSSVPPFTNIQSTVAPTSATLTPTSGVARTIRGVHFGLPVIGFMMHNYRNGSVQSSYGGVIEHKFTTRIE